jgi:uncharacterized membrane protein YhiD involved in acid resistance
MSNTLKEFIIENWEAILVPVTGLVVWIFSKRHFQKLQLESDQIDNNTKNLGNVTANFEVYQKLIDDLEVRFKNRIEELEKDLDKMKTLNNELRSAVARQERYINKLLIKLDSYENPQN